MSPRKITARLLGRKLLKPEVKDIVALRVEVSGDKNGKPKKISYSMLDEYDRERGVTAMARTTAYPASIAAQLLLKKTITEKGVIPPEKIGRHDEYFKHFGEELQKRNVKITEQEN
jgi:lysine 6-dehydrogenase